VKIVTVYVTGAMFKALQGLVELGIYTGKSEIFRTAVRDALLSLDTMSADSTPIPSGGRLVENADHDTLRNHITTINLPTIYCEAVDAIAKQLGTTRSAYLRAAIRHLIEKEVEVIDAAESIVSPSAAPLVVAPRPVDMRTFRQKRPVVMKLGRRA